MASSQPLADVDLREIVLSYLAHHCYSATAELLFDGSHHDLKLQKNIEKRSRILALIRAGLISDAITLIDEADAGLLAKHKRLRFQLLSQQFIEELRHAKHSAALVFAQKHLKPLACNDQELTLQLQPIVSLMAFKDVSASNSPLLRQERREMLASQVNSALLAAAGLRERPILEDLAKQLVVVDEALEGRSVFAQALSDRCQK